jgi:hypothetical protein
VNDPWVRAEFEQIQVCGDDQEYSCHALSDVRFRIRSLLSTSTKPSLTWSCFLTGHLSAACFSRSPFKPLCK